jgi:hypothetical protein
MRSLWRLAVRVVFWSYDRGTWPYDVAVAVIVLFVLLSPRSWFNDRPPLETPVATMQTAPMVELRGADPIDGADIYRVDARLVPGGARAAEADLKIQLLEAVRKYAKRVRGSGSLEIVRISPVLGREGAIAYYDVCIKP